MLLPFVTVSIAVEPLIAAVAVLTAGVAVLLWPVTGHDRAVVTFRSSTGNSESRVVAEVADTAPEWHRGLGGRDALPEGEGMLFAFRLTLTRRMVMRNMSFGIDMIFLDSDGQVTEIHSAPAPEDGSSSFERYSGRAKYVLEVPEGFARSQGISVGDEAEIRWGSGEEAA